MIFSKVDLSLKEFIKKDSVVRLFLFLAMILNIVDWIFIYYRFARFLKGTEEIVILHYNIYFGIDQLGEWGNIYHLPLIGLGVLIINFFISYLLYFQDKMISYFFLAIAVFSQIFFIVATFFIILVNQY